VVSWREGARRRVLAGLSAERARRVITISEFSKREICTHFGIDAAKVAVAYPGVTRIPGTLAGATRSAAALYVGSIFNRRHVPEMIAAFGDVASRHPAAELDIVGDNRTSRPSTLPRLRPAAEPANGFTCGRT
jgi:glycosyltransferase involved in cell wall biosynthesis